MFIINKRLLETPYAFLRDAGTFHTLKMNTFTFIKEVSIGEFLNWKKKKDFPISDGISQQNQVKKLAMYMIDWQLKYLVMFEIITL